MDTLTLDNIKFIHVGETDSTNEEVKRRAQHPFTPLLVCADYQTAGRGQKGNSWESERGKNLLFSVMLWPQGISAGCQFRLSQCMALAVSEVLGVKSQISNFKSQINIKWPNDIYFGEKKLCGTVIETTLSGAKVERCILGVGINVNQREFHSDAPNPVSLCQIADQELDCHELLMGVTECFCHWYNCLMRGEEQEIARQYAARLIWREGLHRYCDREGEFAAEFVCVAPDGRLTLRDGEGRERSYYFKEVKHVFPSLICE